MPRGQRFRNNAKREFNRYWRNKQKQKAMRVEDAMQGDSKEPFDPESEKSGQAWTETMKNSPNEWR